MALTDFGSYVTTGEEIKSHWSDVNAARIASGGTALVLTDGTSLANLTTEVGVVAAANTAQEGLDNAVTLAATARDTNRRAKRDRVIEFREAVQYRLKASGYALSLPDTPHPNASEQKILAALDDMNNLWLRINADTTVPNFTPPLILRNGVTLAISQADVTTLRAAYQAVTEAENDARIGRNQREILLPPLSGHFVLYREAISVEYGPDHPFTKSLPDVYPQTGSTPSRVTLSGVWNAVTGQADLSWTESTDPDLLEYEVRMSVGSTYDAATATVIANLPPGTTTFSTTAGLENPGDVASFKVFVILTTGNEAGSNTVTITRP